MPNGQLIAISLVLANSAACSQPANTQIGEARPQVQEAKIAQEQSSGAAVSDLPYAPGKSFRTLDEYLAHLRKRGAYDVPYYEEISPGVYEVVGRRGPGAPRLTYTREELERKFGFRK
jgi:hypothetical protein